MGRPLEKLSIFFEGVETLIQSGVAEEDVKYQIEYSKQELKKICKIYNAKDVRKGLQISLKVKLIELVLWFW